jgi:hypothetical protein
MNVTNEMVDRFLTWPVPAEVYPDGTPGQPGRSGTNLLNAIQAKAMLEHVLGSGLIIHKHDEAHGISGTHIAGSERFECAVCGHVLSAEESKSRGLKYVLDVTPNAEVSGRAA